VDKSETIYYYSNPSKTTLKAFFPDHIEDIQINNREIRFYYRNSQNTLNEIVGTTLVNISGNLSIKPGTHYIVIESMGDEVSITE
jgi:uncharacterized protein YbcI